MLLYFHALTDVNGDGFADLIYTTQSSTNVYVQYSNGSSFGSPVVVASDASNTIKLCTNNTCPPPSGQAWINAVGDVNGDGLPDILFGDGTVALAPGFGPKIPWGGDASLNGTSWVRITANGSPGRSQQTLLYFHALADVNGDGFADLIYTTQSSTDVYVQYSNGSSFGSPVVVVSDASNTIQLCTNNTCPPPSGQAWINAVGDVNGDQQQDLLFANGSVTTVLRNVTLYPQYIIGSVIYVPPGQGPSTITYGTGTVTGTTLSTTETWKNSSTVGSGNIGSAANGVSVEFGFEFGGSTTNTVDMAETTNQSTGYRGSPSNSIDHDHD